MNIPLISKFSTRGIGLPPLPILPLGLHSRLRLVSPILCQAVSSKSLKSGGSKQHKKAKKSKDNSSRAGRPRVQKPSSRAEGEKEASTSASTKEPVSPELARQRSVSCKRRDRKVVKLDQLYWNPPGTPIAEMDPTFLPKVDELAAQIRISGLKGRPIDVYVLKGRHYVRTIAPVRLTALSRVDNLASCPVRVLNHDDPAQLPPKFAEKAIFYVPFQKASVSAWLRGEAETARPKGRGKTLLATGERAAGVAVSGTAKKEPSPKEEGSRGTLPGPQNTEAKATPASAKKEVSKKDATSAPVRGGVGLAALAALKKKL